MRQHHLTSCIPLHGYIGLLLDGNHIQETSSLPLPDDDDPIMPSFSPEVTTKCLEASQNGSGANQQLCTGSLKNPDLIVDSFVMVPEAVTVPGQSLADEFSSFVNIGRPGAEASLYTDDESSTDKLVLPRSSPPVRQAYTIDNIVDTHMHLLQQIDDPVESTYDIYD